MTRKPDVAVSEPSKARARRRWKLAAYIGAGVLMFRGAAAIVGDIQMFALQRYYAGGPRRQPAPAQQDADEREAPRYFGLSAVQERDVNGDGIADLLVGCNGDSVCAYDGRDLRFLWMATAKSGGVEAFDLGQRRLATVAQRGVTIFELVNGVPTQSAIIKLNVQIADPFVVVDDTRDEVWVASSDMKDRFGVVNLKTKELRAAKPSSAVDVSCAERPRFDCPNYLRFGVGHADTSIALKTTGTQLEARDTSGALLWTWSTHANQSDVVASQGRVFVRAGEDAFSAQLEVLSASDGKELWKMPTPNYLEVAVFTDRVLVHRAAGLAVRDAATGKEVGCIGNCAND